MAVRKVVDETERVRVRCDVLVKIIEKLDSNPELQDIFGIPVSKALVVVADGNDLRIEDGGSVDLTEEQSKRFLEILNEVIKASTH
ncbi:MAG: hypothetical protein DRO90_03360 [Candidatus Altiarchaeales archaeon]|nr:MAG: hypothetical protein DRO90_03360 [Candidatus Altiarchaeales archaeon]